MIEKKDILGGIFITLLLSTCILGLKGKTVSPINTKHDAKIQEEFANIYDHLYGIKKQEFEWDPGSVADGSGAVTTFQLSEDGIIIGVDVPQATVSGMQWGTLDRFNTGFGVYKTDTGGPIQVVAWRNGTGASYDPPKRTWKIWYIPL